jgi:carboxyl-terminal processing protease
MERLFKTAMASIAGLAIVAAAFLGGFALGKPDLPAVTHDAALTNAVKEVADIIQKEALEPSSEESMTVGAVKGLLESLDDPYAMYFDEKHYGYFNEQTSGTFYGIGVTIQNRENDLVIVSVIEGTPAEKAGLKADDVIVTIDGESREKWDVEEAVLRIRGEEGTKVTLGIRRGDATEIKEYTITRAKIDVPNIESEVLEGRIGYIRLYSFNEHAEEDLRKEI